MLVVISPAKRLDWSETPDVSATVPDFQDDAVKLAKSASRLSRPKLQALMDISPALAELNQARFKTFESEPDADVVRPAAYAFAGDTYAGLEARTLDPDTMDWAQSHLRILSGLYGVLRPCDAIQPYRLEMGSRLITRRGGSLYAYWGDRISRSLNDAADATDSTVLVNCASQEYFGAVDLKRLQPSVITPRFLEDRPGGPKVISFLAKKARGAMARFVSENRITDPADLRDFTTGGYAYQPDQSTEDAPVFLRSEAADKAA
jgi:cytoplasmic iron level regulating protein YaaA (DUF328/UPF0246 family)